MSRNFLIAVTAAGMVAFAPCALAENPVPGTGAVHAMTVKSSKSNSSDRQGQTTQSGGAGPAQGTTVKSSKSNSSERKGQTPGGSGPANAINLNSSRSN